LDCLYRDSHGGTVKSSPLTAICITGQQEILRVGWVRPRDKRVCFGQTTNEEAAMIFIVVKFETKPEWSDRWPDLVASFTEATRAEDGNLWFEWSRSLDNPDEYVLVEAFRDSDAGSAHVDSDHFKKAINDMPQALKSTPKIISQTIDATGWSKMGEMTVD
jgi:quinol monooxygenase YgiN